MASTPEELGDEIKAARLAAGMTLVALAAKAGVTEGRIRHIEKGYESRGDFQIPVRISERTLIGLLQALGQHAGPLLRELATPLLQPLGRSASDAEDVLPLDGIDEATRGYLRTIAEEARRRNLDAQ